MATQGATLIIPVGTQVARGRISDSEACSIRSLRFHTNTERRRELPTNMRHDLHTNMKRRRGRPQAYPAPITTPATTNNDTEAITGLRGRSRRTNTSGAGLQLLSFARQESIFDLPLNREGLVRSLVFLTPCCHRFTYVPLT